MGLKRTVAKTTRSVTGSRFWLREAELVPTTEMLRPNGAVRLTAVFLCASLDDSAELVTAHPRETAARVVRGFLNAASQIVASRGGEVRGFDATRIDAVFTGKQAADRGARAALEIKWILDAVVQPELRGQLEPIKGSGWTLRHRAGLDVGEVMAFRGGVRERNDLVIIGEAPGVAARLCELARQRTQITDRLWQAMSSETRVSGSNDDKPMWSEPQPVTLDTGDVLTRSSNWGWVVP